jgi:hypothetical protein
VVNLRLIKANTEAIQGNSQEFFQYSARTYMAGRRGEKREWLLSVLEG